MIVNLTPHEIIVRKPYGGTVTIPSSGVARVTSKPGIPLPFIDCPDGLECWTAPAFGAVEGLPEPVEGVAYIVSGMVASRVYKRPDVFSPGTGPNDGAIRDEKGQIVAVTRLIRSC